MIKLQGQSRIISKGDVFDVAREGCVQYIDGKPTKRDVQYFKAQGSLQPLSGRDLLLVPEGDRTKELWWFFSATKLELNDRIIREKASYQVQTVEDWGSFNKARLCRIDVGARATT